MNLVYLGEIKINKMIEFDNLKLELSEGILTITINRPEKLNALNQATIKEIGEAMEEVRDNTDIQSVIMTGAGEKAFVAGADISEIASLDEVYGRKFSEAGQEVFAMIENCDKPVIAAISGFALGGGLELAMSCHMRIATENAKFGLPELTLGLIPGFGGTQRLPLLIGRGKALEMILTGDMITAERAQSLGLVNHVAVDKAAVLEKSKKILGKIMTKAPLAVGKAIHCINDALDHEKNGFQTEANSFGNCFKTEDFKEGTEAFLAKRPAVFKGE